MGPGTGWRSTGRCWTMRVAGPPRSLDRPHPDVSGRDMSWTAVSPKDDSAAGRQRPGGSTRGGDETLRRVLVSGAMAVVRRAKPGRSSPWLLGLLARKSKTEAAVALANKTARIAWAMMRRGETYRRPVAA